MPPSRYRVVSSDKAREELRTVLAQAEAEGRRESVVAVVRKVNRARRPVKQAGEAGTAGLR